MKIQELTYSHVLYTTEFSENWEDVFANAVSIAKKYDAKLTVLHVLNTDFIDLLVFDVGIERASSVEKRLTLVKDYTSNAKESVLSKLKDIMDQGLLSETDVLVERGNPVKTILKVAEEKNCDLIVMGFKGRATFEDATIGDTVNRVLHRSKLPVLVIHNNKDK